jgi:hypothetical protein
VQPDTVHVVWFEFVPHSQPVERPVLGALR